MEAKYLTVVVSRSNAIEIPMAEEVWAGMSEADQDAFVRQYAANHYKENLKWRVAPQKEITVELNIKKAATDGN